MSRARMRMRMGIGIGLGIAALLSTACERIVLGGQTATLEEGLEIIAVNHPNAAAVQPGATLVVEGAALRGLDRTFEEGTADAPSPGAAIVSDGGTVQILAGRIMAGTVEITRSDPSGPPSPVLLPFSLASALVARDSTIDIRGGSFVSSAFIGRIPVLLADAPVVTVSDSSLTLSGGQFLLGDNPGRGGPFPVTPTVLAARSRVSILDGDFSAGPVQLFSSQAVIRGGRFDRGLALGFRPPVLGFTPVPGGLDNVPRTPIVPAPGCTEIRGGSFALVGALEPGERLFLYGSFSLPPGPLTPPPGTPQTPGGRVFPDDQIPPIRIDGTLQDGTEAHFDLLLTPGAQAVLDPGAPDGPGCSS